MRWDPAQYSRFAAERDRPFFDLTSRIEASPHHVVDLGCGQGHQTATLAARWPDAIIQGIDSSQEMISDALQMVESGVAPGVSFSVGDIAAWQPASDVDVIVSNAALHWLPDHQDLMAEWASALPTGGWLAVQVPGSFTSPSHVLMRELAAQPPWGSKLEAVVHQKLAIGTPESYAELLLGAGMTADVWETTYVHVLQGEDAVLEWMKGTGLRPILAALSPDEAGEYAAKLAAGLRKAYPQGPYGTLYPFRRVFAVGRKG
ncbi:MAG: trans-aconitate 2-methyltransferase [Mycobacterium sp.]|jgi:trans-aconitate 2-methyltransferase|nr:trans-aconitate 2-methyltransferase [Mycobacterium sp.]